jgi:RNA polymerase sigma factor (sigma-70 family)
MPATSMSEVIQHLRSAALRNGAGLTDGQLLERFVGRREPADLEALVVRHGPMVWGVCRRLLRTEQDAEDAFQATFLVLVRKAASVSPPGRVGNWLYGVAYQTALKARATRAKRAVREGAVEDMPEPAASEPEPWAELQPLLDRELKGLPEKYRTALVLCEQEGKTVREAAQELGCPDGTVASRLARSRELLARRLSRRGALVTSGSLAGVLAKQAASASVPPAVLSSTVKAVTLVAAGRTAAAGLISARVAALAEGAVKTVLVNKLKGLATAPFAAGAIALTWGVVAGQAPGLRGDAKAGARAGPSVGAKDKLSGTRQLAQAESRNGSGGVLDKPGPGGTPPPQAGDAPRRCQWYDASNFKICFSEDRKRLVAEVPGSTDAWRATLTHKTKLDVGDPAQLTFTLHGNVVRVLGCAGTYADYERKTGEVIASGKTTDSSFKRVPASVWDGWKAGGSHPVNRQLVATDQPRALEAGARLSVARRGGGRPPAGEADVVARGRPP